MEPASTTLRLPLRRIVLWLAATTVLWLAVSGVLLLRARGKAVAAESSISALAGLDGLDDLDLDETIAELEAAAADLGDARNALENPILLPMRLVPIAGRQVTSARALVRSADELVSDALVVLATAKQASDGVQGDRVATLTELADGLDALAVTIDDVDLGPPDGLVGPLANGRSDAEEKIAELAPRVDRFAVVARGLAHFLDDGKYLLLGANNAEMRIASGMHLSVGEITLSGGHFEVPGLVPADDLDPIGGAALVDSSVAERWGFLTPQDDFRKVTYSARFDEFVGPQALELWRAETGDRLDGVISLDPFVLGALLEVVGSVEVDGETFDSGNAVTYLLEEQYATFDAAAEEFPDSVADVEGEVGDDGEFEALRDARRDRLSQLASAVAIELGSSSWDPLDLVRALEPAAEGRHILAYSVDPTEQAAWAALGIDGHLDGTETGVYWLNTGASKLDPFLEIEVEVSESVVDGVREITYDVTTTNQGSAALPEYTVGPWQSFELPEAGAYRGRIAFYAPNGVLGADLDPSLKVDVFGPDGANLLVSSAPLTILPGETVVHSFTYRLPEALDRVTLLPAVRFPAVTWHWGDQSFDDSIVRTVDLGG